MIALRTILHESFWNTVCTLILLTYIIFIASPWIWSIPRRVLHPPSLNNYQNLPHMTILVGKLSPKRTSPPSYFSYSQNHFLWGVIWKDAPKSTHQESWHNCVMMDSKYTSLCLPKRFFLHLTDSCQILAFCLQFLTCSPSWKPNFTALPTFPSQLSRRFRLAPKFRFPIGIFSLSSVNLLTSLR